MSLSSQISLMSLFEKGAQRGNSRSNLNPKLKSKIYGYDKGLCIIDLVQTINSLEKVTDFVKKLGQRKKQILVVGTSQYLQNTTADFAAKLGNSTPFVNNRWLGGTLTNWATIRKTLKTLEKLENIENNKEFFNKLARNEQLNIQDKKEKVGKFFGGLKTLKNNRPGAILVIDSPQNPVAIQEAEVMGIPVIAFTNTTVKVLPKNLDYAVVCNIYSRNLMALVLDELVNSYGEGLAMEIQKEATKVKVEN